MTSDAGPSVNTPHAFEPMHGVPVRCKQCAEQRDHKLHAKPGAVEHVLTRENATPEILAALKRVDDAWEARNTAERAFNSALFEHARAKEAYEKTLRAAGYR